MTTIAMGNQNRIAQSPFRHGRLAACVDRNVMALACVAITESPTTCQGVSLLPRIKS
jgi:hypothetical protein